MDRNRYSSQQDYCDAARNFQSVPSQSEVAAQKPELNSDDIWAERLNTRYSCPDNYQMGSIQDNQIYIATTDNQHTQVSKGVHVDADRGLSGYFSDQATVDACKNGGSLDNTKYNEMCQISPYRNRGIDGTGDATYKPHVDCFEIDRDALFREYGTRDFNAAIAKCEANNHFGSGGGNQGYNPYLSDMIDKKALNYCPEKSYSDKVLSHSEHNNPNQLTNSVVPAVRADQMYLDAQTRAQDCVVNNTPNPSPEACKNGFPPNEHPIQSNTGHAIPVRGEDPASCGASKKDLPPIEPPQSSEGHPAGASKLSEITPIENSTAMNNLAVSAEQGLAENAKNATKGMTGGMA